MASGEDPNVVKDKLVTSPSVETARLPASVLEGPLFPKGNIFLQPVSVRLSGNLDGETFSGTWNYVSEPAPPKPFLFHYSRSHSKLAPIPAWQFSLMRGASESEVLDLWTSNRPEPAEAEAAQVAAPPPTPFFSVRPWVLKFEDFDF